MNKIAYLISSLIIFFLLSSICPAQKKKKFGTVLSPASKEQTIDESSDCWNEFKESSANFSVKVCGNFRKDILNDSFKNKKIARNSYLVSNKNATYIVGWFLWKLENEDENSLKSIYDKYSEETVKKGVSGSIADSKDIFLNDKLGRETNFNVNKNQKLFMRTFYRSGKFYYVAFLPNNIDSDEKKLDEFKNRFFESFQNLNSK